MNQIDLTQNDAQFRAVSHDRPVFCPWSYVWFLTCLSNWSV